MQNIFKIWRHLVSKKATILQRKTTCTLEKPLTSRAYLIGRLLSQKSDRPGGSNFWKILLRSAFAATIFAGLVSHYVKGRKLEDGELPAKPKFSFLSGDKDNLNLRNHFNFINKVVEKCASAVVYVEIRDPRRFDKSSDDTLIVSNGSGFIVTEDGWILTNAHVVINKPNATVQVKLQNGETYVATVEDADMNIDLALIKIQPPNKLPALKLAKPGDVKVGEWVVALGSPLSLSHSATAGVVSCVNRAADELGLRNFQMKYIQTDAPITFGNSGGPLVNLDGEVIGINNLRITAGISFAIPVEFVERFMNRLKNYHTQPLSHDVTNLDITTITLNEDIMENVAAKFNFSSNEIHRGVFVWKILPEGTGDRAGLKVGDIITHVNGKSVGCPTEIYEAINKENKFSLDLVRDGKPINLLVDAIKMK